MAKRLTYDFVNSEFGDRGYTLVSKEYKNSYTKLEYICPNKHKSSISWDSFKQGHGCSFCFGNNSYDFDEVKEEFKKRGYILLSEKYTGVHSVLECICPEGHKRRVSWRIFKQGHRCRECVGLNKKSREVVAEEFESEGYVLLSVEYVNAIEKLDYLCSVGHFGSMDWNSFQQGRRCPKCSRERASTNQRHSIERVRRLFKSKGFTLISTEYKSNGAPLKCICPVGHCINKTYTSIKSGKGCEVCSKSGKSKSEKEIVDFIKSFYFGKVLENSRKITPPYELDIYIPEKKLAIEYNGLYWHSEAQGKDKFYHYNKTKRCAEKGIRLITIFEDEFLAGKEKVFAKLKSVIENLNTIFPTYTKAGILSDLNWDGLTSKDLYIKEGFVFSGDIDPIDYYIKNKKRRVKVKGPQVAEKVNKIWDCGHMLYNRGK